jgi:hypothetical protein
MTLYCGNETNLRGVCAYRPKVITITAFLFISQVIGQQNCSSIKCLELGLGTLQQSAYIIDSYNQANASLKNNRTRRSPKISKPTTWTYINTGAQDCSNSVQ